MLEKGSFLKSFAILKQKNIPFNLTIIGDGIELEKLKALSKELNIEKEVVDTEVSDAETDTDEAAYVDEDDYYDPGHGELEDPEDQDWGGVNSNNDLSS